MTRTRKILLLPLLAVAFLMMFTGCANVSTIKSPVYSKIEITDAANNQKIRTVLNDDELLPLSDFTLDELGDIKATALPADSEPLYRFVFYETPANIAASHEGRQLFALTTYADTDIVGFALEPGAVNGARLPNGALTFTLELPHNIVTQLGQLAELGTEMPE